MTNINEDFPMKMPDYAEERHKFGRLHVNRGHRMAIKSGKNKVGEIGTYHVHAINPYEKNKTVDYYLTHPDPSGKHNIVGMVRLNANEHIPDLHPSGTHLVVGYTKVTKSHRGKGAKVKHLVPKLYDFASQHSNLPIVSGAEQSRGGRSVWTRLSKLTNRVQMYHEKGRSVTTKSGEQMSQPQFSRLHSQMSHHAYRARTPETVYDPESMSYKTNPPQPKRMQYAKRIAKRLGINLDSEQATSVFNTGATQSAPKLAGPYSPKKHGPEAYSRNYGGYTKLVLMPPEKK